MPQPRLSMRKIKEVLRLAGTGVETRTDHPQLRDFAKHNTRRRGYRLSHGAWWLFRRLASLKPPRWLRQVKGRPTRSRIVHRNIISLIRCVYLSWWPL
jgi:hypothetical protein